MTPARVTRAHVNAIDLRAVLLENSRQLLWIDVAFEKLRGIKVVGASAITSTYSAIGLDVKRVEGKSMLPATTALSLTCNFSQMRSEPAPGRPEPRKGGQKSREIFPTAKQKPGSLPAPFPSLTPTALSL